MFICVYLRAFVVKMNNKIETIGFENLDIDIKNIVQTTLTHIHFTDPYQISIELTTNDAVQKLNAQYRGKDKATNVLSFPAYDPDDPQIPGESIHLGDIVLAKETIEHESIDLNIPFQDHLIHLIVHGTLHLMGYDHENDKDANIMEALEIEILNRLNIKNPYA